MFGTQEARLLVHITDRTEVTSDNLVVGLLPGIVFRHLKHAEVQVGDWTERATCYEDEWLLGRVSHDPLEAMGWERITLWAGELSCLCCHCVAEGVDLDRDGCGGRGEGSQGEPFVVK